jgi:outer membrane protein OmpA-like peptidoglycan-associated protein
MDANFELKFLSLKKIDQDLAKLSPECPPDLITLYSDSAFKFDDFTLTEVGRSQLIQFSRVVKASSKNIKELLITGYADRIGTTIHNTWLSNRRAEEVRIFLERELKNSESPVSLVVLAKGSADAIIEDCEKARNRVACEAPNRRVELEIIKKEDAGVRPPT